MTATTEQLRKFNKAVSITGIDEEQRLVYGIASTESIDAQGDIVTADAMREALPEYMEWGNLRYMHQDGRVDAVGKVLDAEVRPDGKTYITAKVVDDDAWAKVKAGVLQGFSIGGDVLETAAKYIKDRLVNVITRLRLVEISLVDSPANPEAKILLYKGQGLEMAKKPTTPVTSTEAGAINDALAGMQAATERAVSLRKRFGKAATLEKAATPDKIVDQLLDLHNEMIKNGNPDGASMITDAIACLQGALQDEAVDQEQGTPDPNADDLAEGGIDPTLDAGAGEYDPGEVEQFKADGVASEDDDNGDQPGNGSGDDGEGVDKADMSISDGADITDGESNPDVEGSMDGTNIDAVTDNTTSDPESVQPKEARKAQARKTATSPTILKAQAVHARLNAGSEALKLQKAQAAVFNKFANDMVETLAEISKRLEALEKRPRSGGPVLSPVNKSLTAGGGNEPQKGNEQDSIQQLEAMIEKESNPFVKMQLGNALAQKRLRASYGMRG